MLAWLAVPGGGSRETRSWVVAGALAALAALAAYQPALRNAPTYDDAVQIRLWPVPATLGEWAAVPIHPWWPEIGVWHEWRPLAQATILAQRALQGASGTDWPFYAFNIAAHAAVCLLLLAAAASWCIDRRAAFAGTLIFALHPLHAEAVHQIVGRTELMAAGWMLAGTILWSRGGAENIHAFWQQPLILILALASKEHAVLYPALILLAALAGPFPAQPPEGRRRRLGSASPIRLCVLMLVLALVLAGYLAAKDRITAGLFTPKDAISPSKNLLAGMAFGDRLPAALGILGYWLAKFAWPAGLSPDYSAESLPLALGWRWGYAWLGAALASAIAAYAILDIRRGGRGWAVAVAGAASFCLTSNLFLTIGVSMAPRLIYWPTVPAAIGAGWILVRLWDGFAAPRIPAGRRAAAGALALSILATGLASCAWRDGRAWRSPEAFADATLAVFPGNWTALVQRSLQLCQAGESDEGLMLARRAVELFPDETLGWSAVALNAKRIPGGAAEAKNAFKRSLALDPGKPETWRNYGNLLADLGRNAEAAEAYGRYLEFEHAPDRAGIAQRRDLLLKKGL